jgi:hypothetical protein
MADPPHNDRRALAPLEGPVIHGGDNSVKTSIPHKKDEVKATSFLMGFPNCIGIWGI